MVGAKYILYSIKTNSYDTMIHWYELFLLENDNYKNLVMFACKKIETLK